MELIDRAVALHNVLALTILFGAYFVGIVVRRVALPAPDSPSLGRLLLLGVPGSMLAVGGLGSLVLKLDDFDIMRLIAAAAAIMEHGMIVHESALKTIQQLAAQGGLGRHRTAQPSGNL
jgi:hypothetical protein